MVNMRRWFRRAQVSQDEAVAPQQDGVTTRYSFEEFSLYFHTTAAVTDQRISLNRWNYSVCTALVVGSGVFLAWSYDKPRFFYLVMISLVALSVAGTLFALYWMSQIKDLKLLNAAKFKVLNNMAPLVQFSEGARSNEPFAKEWEELGRTGGVRRVKGLQGKLALSSSGAELFMPRVFAALFVVLALAAMLGLILALVAPNSRAYLPVSPESGGSTTVQTASPSQRPSR